MLQVSSYSKAGGAVTFDLGVPDLVARKRAGERTALRTVLAETLPRRLAERWAGEDRPMADWRDQELRAVEESLRGWRVNPAGDEGYGKAEVTLGGVDTAQLSSKTMEAKNVPGLFFVGEVVDVTGQLGGYNFQWAWASGVVAGSAA